MDLSIIIAHYDPGNHASYRESFNQTLSQIESRDLPNTIRESNNSEALKLSLF